jgi:hypothetical protein
VEKKRKPRTNENLGENRKSFGSFAGRLRAQLRFSPHNFGTVAEAGRLTVKRVSFARDNAT